MALIILLYVLFGSVFTIAKTGLEFSQPFFFVGSRMLVAGILLLAYEYFFKKQSFTINKKNGWLLLRLAIFNIYLTNVFEFWGLQYLTSFKTCFIYSLSPFVSALFSFFVFSEKMTPKKWIGLIVGFVGFLPILLVGTSQENETGHLLFFSWAEIAVMIAAVCSVYGWILLRQLVRDSGCSSVMANGMSMVVGGILSLGHSALVENWDPLPVTSYAPFLECAVMLIIISNFIAYNLYGHLLKTYTATFVSFAGFTTPIFTALFGWMFLGEMITWPFYVSLVVVFMGLVLFYQEELKLGYYSPSSSEPVPTQ